MRPTGNLGGESRSGKFPETNDPHPKFWSSSVVEQSAVNRLVLGPWSLVRSQAPEPMFRMPVAQLAEQRPPKPKVEGSTPSRYAKS